MSTIKVIGLKEPLPINSIIWIEGDGNYARIHLADNKTYLAADTLKKFEVRLASFVRIHKSGLINPRYIRRFEQSKAKEAYVEMSSGQLFQLAQRRIASVRSQLGMPSFQATNFCLSLQSH